jgi:hypothetical protein
VIPSRPVPPPSGEPVERFNIKFQGFEDVPAPKAVSLSDASLRALTKIQFGQELKDANGKPIITDAGTIADVLVDVPARDATGNVIYDAAGRVMTTKKPANIGDILRRPWEEQLEIIKSLPTELKHISNNTLAQTALLNQLNTGISALTISRANLIAQYLPPMGPPDLKTNGMPNIIDAVAWAKNSGADKSKYIAYMVMRRATLEKTGGAGPVDSMMPVKVVDQKTNAIVAALDYNDTIGLIGPGSVESFFTRNTYWSQYKAGKPRYVILGRKINLRKWVAVYKIGNAVP